MISKTIWYEEPEETWYILGIKLLWDHKNKLIELSQATYIDKILAKFNIENFKKDLLSFKHGIQLSKDQSLKTLGK